jgi:hypothetical protein
VRRLAKQQETPDNDNYSEEGFDKPDELMPLPKPRAVNAPNSLMNSKKSKILDTEGTE